MNNSTHTHTRTHTPCFLEHRGFYPAIHTGVNSSSPCTNITAARETHLSTMLVVAPRLFPPVSRIVIVLPLQWMQLLFKHNHRKWLRFLTPAHSMLRPESDVKLPKSCSRIFQNYISGVLVIWYPHYTATGWKIMWKKSCFSERAVWIGWCLVKSCEKIPVTFGLFWIGFSVWSTRSWLHHCPTTWPRHCKAWNLWMRSLESIGGTTRRGTCRWAGMDVSTF